jgi:uncharacterized Zn-binding protein involved in type VI secretion
MPFAALLFSTALHPGVVASGCPTVVVNGLPAARQGDDFACALAPLAGPHPMNKISGGSSSVRIGGLAAARIGDLTGCGAVLATGAGTVQIGG